MKALLLPLAACAALGGCVTYGDTYGYGYGGGGYVYPSYGAYGGYSNGYPTAVYQPNVYAPNVYVAPGYVYNQPRVVPGRGGRDRDRDGIPNRVDRDRDNDGVPNRRDSHPNDPRRR